MPTEIVNGVYDITCLERDGNRFRAFLCTEDTPTLIDTGFADTTDALFEDIDEVGVVPKRVIVTHGDDDHAGGLEAVVEAYDPKVWVPEQTPFDVDGPVERYGDGDRIGRFTAVHVPGHEPDNHALIDEDAGIAALGDAVSGTDRYGLPAGYFHLPPAHHSRDLILAAESLEALLPYDFDVGLVFHGTSVTEDASEKLESYVNYAGKP